MKISRCFLLWMLALVSMGTFTGCGIEATSPAAAIASAANVPPVSQPAGSITCAKYGCLGDGIADDTLAIRKTIEAACNNNGGVIFFPAGTYKISLQARDEMAAISITCSHITIQGAGRSYTIFSQYAIGDADPDSVCPLDSSGQVNRGAGFYISSNDTAGLEEIHIADIRLTGNRVTYAARSGSYVWPATPGNCYNVWDTSNRGILYKYGMPLSNSSVIDCEVDHFGGELIVGGSVDNPGRIFSGNILHHSNGDGVSFSGRLTVTGNTIYEIGSSGIEDNSNLGDQIIQNNTIYTIKNGINLAPIDHVPNPPAWDVSNNTITDAQMFGILNQAENSHIYNNTIEDSGWDTSGKYVALSVANDVVGYPGSILDRMEMDHNTITSRTKAIQEGIVAVMGDSLVGSNISIHDNSFNVSSTGHIGTLIETTSATITNLTVYNNTMQ